MHLITLRERLSDARHARNWDLIIQLENEIGEAIEAADQSDVAADTTDGELLPQVEGSDAVQSAPPSTKRRKK